MDVLVNSAGHGPNGPVLEILDDDWHAGMEVYLLNVIRPTRLVTLLLQAQDGGAIINISTFAAFEPDSLFPTSGVFRAGWVVFTKLYADEHAPENIRVNNVLPGFIDSLPETEDRRAAPRAHPDGTLRTRGRVSSLISWLASDGAGYMTGQNLRID